MTDVPVVIKQDGVESKYKFQSNQSVKQVLEKHFQGAYYQFTQQSQVLFESSAKQEVVSDYDLTLYSFDERKVGKAVVFQIVPQQFQRPKLQQIPDYLEQSIAGPNSGPNSGPYNPNPNSIHQAQDTPTQQAQLRIDRFQMTNGILRNYFQGALTDDYQTAIMADDLTHVRYQTLDGSVRKVLLINPSSTFQSQIHPTEVSMSKEFNGYVLKFSKSRPGFEITWNNGRNGANFHFVYTP